MKKASLGLSISPNSIAEFKSGLREATFQVAMAAQAGMDSTAQEFYSQTQANVPQVTGALASSGKVTAQDSRNTIERTVGYGGSNTNPRTGKPTSDYALQVHEVFNAQRPNSYKWLERTLYNYGNEAFLRNLAASISSVL